MAQLFAWNFAGTGQAAVTDLSGNGRGFTPTGNTTRTAAGGGYTYGGARPNAVGLTQTATGIQVGPSLTGLQPTARTVCGWASINNSSNFWFMEFHRTTEDTGVQGWLNLSFDFRLRLKNSANAVFERLVTPNTAFRFYAFTHDGTTLKVYQSDATGTVQQIGTDVPMAFAVWSADELRVLDGSGPGVVLSDWQGFDTVKTLTELQTLANTPLDATTSVSGTITSTLPGMTGSLTGNAAARGTAAGPIPAMVGSLTGAATVEATESGLLPALAGSFTGDAEARGAAAGPLPGLVGAFIGSVATPPSGTLAAFLPAVNGQLVASVTGGVPTRDLELAMVVQPARLSVIIELSRLNTQVEAARFRGETET